MARTVAKSFAHLVGETDLALAQMGSGFIGDGLWEPTALLRQRHARKVSFWTQVTKGRAADTQDSGTDRDDGG